MQYPEKRSLTLWSHLTRQITFSRATFGPGPRTKGVSDHIQKELKEVEKVYQENDGNPSEGPDCMVHGDAASEWTDVAILGLDGLTRALWAAHPTCTADQIAAMAVERIVLKQGKNELRDWPDWRTADADKAIEHVRGKHD